MNPLERLRAREPLTTDSVFFPPIEREFAGYTELFQGRVLNAGAGSRDISFMVDGELVNQDLASGEHNENIHVLSPLHEVPFEDGHFDVVICNAVLEHVANPQEVIAEFQRVIRPGGVLYLCVPFMQPEHFDPTDFQRYTMDGLSKLVRDHGFEVREATPVHSVYTTLGWIALEWLRPFPGWRGWLLRWALLPWLRRKSQTSSNQVPRIASAYRVVAERLA